MRAAMLLIVFLSACLPSSGRAQPIDPAADLTYSGVGDCSVTAGERVDLRRLWILKDDAIELREGSRFWRIRVNWESVTVETLTGGATGEVEMRDIGLDLDEQRDIDIEVRLAVLEGTLVAYWRETYQHRRYRQGLYRFEGGKFEPWCEGVGGIEAIH